MSKILKKRKPNYNPSAQDLLSPELTPSQTWKSTICHFVYWLGWRRVSRTFLCQPLPSESTYSQGCRHVISILKSNVSFQQRPWKKRVLHACACEPTVHQLRPGAAYRLICCQAIAETISDSFKRVCHILPATWDNSIGADAIAPSVLPRSNTISSLSCVTHSPAMDWAIRDQSTLSSRFRFYHTVASSLQKAPHKDLIVQFVRNITCEKKDGMVDLWGCEQ